MTTQIIKTILKFFTFTFSFHYKLKIHLAIDNQ
jgi:hypothetical protein